MDEIFSFVSGSIEFPQVFAAATDWVVKIIEVNILSTIRPDIFVLNDGGIAASAPIAAPTLVAAVFSNNRVSYRSNSFPIANGSKYLR